MHHVTFQPPHGGAKGEITAGGVVRLVKGNAVEIRRQRPDLAGFMGRPDQVIAVLPIQAAERANNVPNVSADTKVCTAPDIYGDLHGSDLTIGAHRNTVELILWTSGEFGFRLWPRPEFSRAARDRAGKLPPSRRPAAALPPRDQHRFACAGLARSSARFGAFRLLSFHESSEPAYRCGYRSVSGAGWYQTESRSY